MSHEVETMFSRTVPWHGLGVVTGEAVSAEEALVAAGLDWEVEKRLVYDQDDDGTLEKIEGKFVIRRKTDKSRFGIVGPDFVPLQNSEAFRVLDDLVSSGQLKFDSAGSLRGGRYVFVSAKLPEAVKLLGHESLDLYAMLGHGHDGTRAIRVDLTPILPVCMNTVKLAQRSAKSTMSVQHRVNARARLAAAGEIMGLVHDYVSVIREVSEKLAAQEVNEDRGSLFLEKLYSDLPSKDQQVRAIAGTASTWEYSQNIRDEHRFTGWGAWQAVTEYFDWKRSANAKPETRFNTSQLGVGRHYRERALDLLKV